MARFPTKPYPLATVLKPRKTRSTVSVRKPTWGSVFWLAVGLFIVLSAMCFVGMMFANR